jgi:hypothetical protein
LGDARRPTEEIRRRIEFVDLLPQNQERVLHDFFRILPIRHEHVDECRDPMLILGVQRDELLGSDSVFDFFRHGDTGSVAAG